MALAGQPNCGKSTVFNALTGARQHVANYPGGHGGKTWPGWYRYGDVRVTVVDLPGHQ
ncbi:MAG: FeoB small GTPase domain-containing protein [Desulfotignum sp.]|nr:FeoB small GTPase domain-containing protein [Desulfotignum sp.]